MKNPTKQAPVLLLLLSMNLATCQVPAVAAADETASPTTVAPSASNKFDKAGLTALATSLHQVHRTLLKLRRTNEELNSEFNRTSLQIVTFDEYINKYIDGKPVPYDEQLYPYGFQNIGNTSTTTGAPMPPRKDYVTHCADQNSSLSNLLGQELDSTVSLVSTATSDSSINDMLSSLKKAKLSISSQIKSLDELCDKEPYDKGSILKLISAINLECTELDTTLKLTFKMALATERSK